LAEDPEEFEETVYEQSIKLMRVTLPMAPAWQPSYSMRVPEDLVAGEVLEVTASSPMVKVMAQVFRKDPKGALIGPLITAPLSIPLHFQYPVGVPGTYVLRFSQTDMSSIVDVKLRIVVKKPKPKPSDGETPKPSSES
jgi:hypothetical protein